MTRFLSTVEHPETKSFGKQIQSTSIAKYNEDLFEPSQANEYELNEEDEMEDESYLESQDPFGGEPVPKVKTSYADARLEAVQRQVSLLFSFSLAHFARSTLKKLQR